MTTTAATIGAGFRDPVRDAQQTFRAALEAMSRPTLPQPVSPLVTPPAPLGATVGALLLALCDDHTPVWLDARLHEASDVSTWLRFHTAAPLVADPAQAAFVVASAPEHLPALHLLAQGTDEAPHQSATVVIDTTGATRHHAVTATGPGIDGQVRWDAAGFPDGFLAQWQENRARFPRGIDVYFADATTLRALPRTTALITADPTESEDD